MPAAQKLFDLLLLLTTVSAGISEVEFTRPFVHNCVMRMAALVDNMFNIATDWPLLSWTVSENVSLNMGPGSSAPKAAGIWGELAPWRATWSVRRSEDNGNNVLDDLLPHSRSQHYSPVFRSAQTAMQCHLRSTTLGISDVWTHKEKRYLLVYWI